ncbi:MAG: hypothetical protein J5797_00045 [Prevotella sp.]|nr:hypothetical protein [Prevotella sp.]
MRKLKLLLSALALTLGGVLSASAQASFNHTYTKGVTVAAGGDYFLYNIGTKQFLTSGLNYGTRATVDNSGRVLTLTENGSGYNIYTDFVSLNNRAENIRKAGYLTTNGYVDTGTSDAAWVFTPVDVAGYTNAYTIKNDDTHYLFFDVDNTDPGCPVNVGSNTGNNYSYWLLIPRATREQAGDYSHYLINTQMNACWEYRTWGGSTGWNDDAVVAIGGKASNRCGEKYHTVVDIFQDIAVTVPNGKYRLSAQGFYRQDDGKTQDAPDLYANTDKKGIGVLTGTDNSMDDASESFTAGKYADNYVETVVTNGTLRVGINITGANQWVIFDNFVLDLTDPFISVVATEIPAATATALTADKWYKFIAGSSDNFTFATTTIGDIKYTTTDQLLSVASTSATATATMALTEGTTYYIKSSSAQTLTITPQTFTYTVGDATLSLADGKYTQTNTVTLTFADYFTDDPAGIFKILDASKIKVNNAAATASLTDNVLTITLASALAASTDYAVSVAAGAVGYKADAANTAINLTVHTPAVFDGHFYIKKDGADLFFSRGGEENKQTVLDQFGVPVKITTDESNVSRVKFVDTGLLLGASGSSNMYWTDKGDSKPETVNWTIAKSGDKYKFYLNGMENAKKGMNIHTNGTEPKSDTEANACDWELELPAAHPAKLQAVKNAQAAGVATAMGFTGVTTQAQMETYLASLSNNSIAITGTGGNNKEAWQKSASPETDNEYDVFAAETVSGLVPGVYRLRVRAFERIAGGDDVYAAGGAAGLAYVYANDQKVKLASLFDVQSDTQWQEGNDLKFGGKYYANSQTGAQAAFDAGHYANDVYVKVVDEGSGTGSIKFGIKQPNCYYSGQNAANNAQWICYNNFSLTFFDAPATEAQKTALANAITEAEGYTLGFEKGEYAPYNNVAALKALSVAKAIDPATTTGSAAAAATNALKGATWTKNTAQMDAVYNGNFANSTPNANSGVDVDMPGWTLVEGIRMVINNTTDYPGLSSASGKAGVFSWGGTNLKYGEETGYTMPLAASTIYELTAKIAGWKDGDLPTWLSASVLKGEKGMASMNILSSEVTKRITDSDPFVTCTVKFVTGEKGDYVLTFAPNKHNVLTDISLKKAASQVLEFADGSDVPSYAPGIYPQVKVTRTLTKDKWITAVYPFELTLTAAFSSFVSVATLSSYNDGALAFSTSSKNTANVPFLMRCTDASAASLASSGITLSNVEVKAATATDATAGDASLKGVYASTDITNAEKNYVLKDNTIYSVGAAGATIPAYRAYIQLAQNADPARLTFFVDGETTAIEGITANEGNEGNVYNLQGQRVTKAQKGLYIQNGRKVLVK